jgi:hypothetical protein
VLPPIVEVNSMYGKDVENEVSKIIEKFGCASVANAMREVMMHEFHASAPGSKVKGLNPLKSLYLENSDQIRLFDHARFYPGFVVFHPYSLTKQDVEFLTQACTDLELEFRIDGASDRVFGAGVRIIVFVPGRVTTENLDKSSALELTPSMIRQIMS